MQTSKYFEFAVVIRTRLTMTEEDAKELFDAIADNSDVQSVKVLTVTTKE